MTTFRPTALTVLAAMLLTGCASFVDDGGPGVADAPPSAGPFERLVGGLPISAELGATLVSSRLVAHPDDGWVGLVLDTSRDMPDFLLDLTAGSSGPQLDQSREVPDVGFEGRLFLTPDGELLMTDSGDPGFELRVFEPGAAEPDVRPLDPPLEYDSLDNPAVLSADGTTLYAGFGAGLFGEARDPAALVAFDVATGEVTAHEELPVESPESTAVIDLAVLPHGGLMAILLQDLTPDDDDVTDAIQLLAQFDADLQLVGAPLELNEDGYRTRAMTVAPDGTAVVTYVQEDAQLHLATVRDGEVLATVDLDADRERAAEVLAVDPDGRYAYLPDARDGQWTLDTVDLESGEVVGSVPLCDVPENGVPPIVSLAADAQSALVLATCNENGEVHAFLVE
jgi:hypothetical protein